jgi:hypothetical protein
MITVKTPYTLYFRQVVIIVVKKSGCGFISASATTDMQIYLPVKMKSVNGS